MSTAIYPPLDKARAEKYGPWAVIAGASDGTGEAFARQLAALGVNLMLVSRRASVLEALAGSIEAEHGVRTRILAQDLMRSDAADVMLRAASDLDVGLYVSNAGSGARGLEDERVGAGFLDRSAADWRGMMNMNVSVVADATHGFASRMAARGSGGVLLMCSMAALAGLPWLTMYSATKAFEMVFAECLWGEFVGSGVKIDVLSVLAPLMDTPTARHTGVDLANMLDMILYQPDDVARQALARLPYGPLLLFPLLRGDPDLEPLTQERRERVLAQLAGQALT